MADAYQTESLLLLAQTALVGVAGFGALFAALAIYTQINVDY